MMATVNDQTKLLSRVRSRVERGERIDVVDCAALFSVRDLGTLAQIARIPRERRHGREAGYRAGGVLDYLVTQDLEAFRMTLTEAVNDDPTAGATVRLRSWGGGSVDGSNERALDLLCDRLGRIVQWAEGIVLNVSPRFIDEISAQSQATHSEVLARMSAIAPLVLSGDEAELFDAGLRSIIAPVSIPSDKWIAIHSAAHALGLQTVAAMSYGTIDHADEYAAHLDRLRTMQDLSASGGFVAFVPMAIHNSDAEEFYLSAPTAVQTLRATAIARIALDNIARINVAPSLVTLEVATVALSYGADTLDRTVVASDVHATEPDVPRRAQSLNDLPVITSDTSQFSQFETSPRLRSHILEARWSPHPDPFPVAPNPSPKPTTKIES